MKQILIKTLIVIAVGLAYDLLAVAGTGYYAPRLGTVAMVFSPLIAAIWEYTEE